MTEHDPNKGVNQTHFSGNSEGGRSTSMDSGGLESGTTSIKSMGDVKNGEPMVTQNQRPKSYQKKSGNFTCGT